MKPRGSIERLPSGRIRARKLDPVTNRYRAVGTFDTEREAELALALPLPAAGKSKGPTLEVLWPEFSKLRRGAVRDFPNEENRWALYVEQHELARIPLRSLTRRHFKLWLAWLKGMDLSVQTRKNALSLVRVVLNDAVEDELLATNPAIGVRVKDEGRSDDPWLVAMPEQQLALLRSVDEVEWPATAAALGLGLRNSEQWRLQWPDVDLEHRKVTIRYSRAGLPTKTGNVRVLPLFGLGLEAFRAAEHARRGSCPYVFPSVGTNDRRADSSAPTKWKEWVRAAGLPAAFRWYDLRHTCATSLLAGWWGPAWTRAEIQHLLGHASAKMTERYAHFLNESLMGAAARTVEFHGGPEEAAKYRATLGIRTPDLRFTNPKHLEGFSGLAVEDFHRRSTRRDSRLAGAILEATRLAYQMGRSPLAKARVHELLRDAAEAVGA